MTCLFRFSAAEKVSSSLIGLALLCAAHSVHAYDGVALEVGAGDSTEEVRAAYQWDWHRQWLAIGNWHLGGYWDAAIGYWHGDDTPDSHRHIVDVGLTPVFRIQQTERSLVSPYLEAAVGVHFISHTAVSGKELATVFQFGDLLGLGARFGGKHQYDLAYRYQHVSNGGIKDPNDGINFHQVRLGYWF